MTQIVKPYTYQPGTTAESAQVNANEDAIIGVVNGNIDDGNVTNGADIDPLKVDDLSATDADARATQSSGNSAVPARALSLEAEVKQLRQKVKMALLGGMAEYMDSGNTERVAGWQEPRVIGPNLFGDSGFEELDARGAVPAVSAFEDPGVSWFHNGTGSAGSMTTGDTDSEVGKGKSLTFTASTTAEGITQIVRGLKANTRYVIGGDFKTNGGTQAVLAVSGGGTADYKSYSRDVTQASWGPIVGIYKTNGSGGDLTVSVITKNGSSTFEVDNMFMYELCADMTEPGVGFMAKTDLASEFTNSSASWSPATNLNTAVTIPGPGFRTVVEASLMLELGAADEVYLRLQQDVDGGGWVEVGSPVKVKADNESGGVRHFNVTMTARNCAAHGGSDYTYRVNTYAATGYVTLKRYGSAPTDDPATCTMTVAVERNG